jgi:cell division protein FtsW
MLLGVCTALVFLGILILTSVSASISLQRYGTTFYFLNHQLLLGLLPGLAAGFIAFLLPVNSLKKWAFPALLFSLLLLLGVFLPLIGTETGAHRWIYVGPFSFQPSELVKLTFILYLASFLANRMERRGNPEKKQGFWSKIGEGKETLLPFLAVVGVLAFFLILQPDISTLGVIAFTALFIYFAAGTPLWHTPLMAIGGLAALYVLVKVAPYRLSRLAVFLDPSLDPLGQGYQIKQALIGIGSGGLVGTGLGLSFQKFGFLPEPISDSVFAVVAEEVGFLGASFVILLFLLFVWRGLLLAKRTDNMFAKLCMVGITSWIALQAFVNMGSIIGFLPLTGIPLPFISYGGSALVVELIAVGILLNMSKETT